MSDNIRQPMQGNAALLGKINDDNFRQARVDSSTESLQTIEYEHHEIHAGSGFHCIEVVDLAINNTRDVQIVTPDSTKWAHMLAAVDTESETEWFLYENVVINNTGTACGIINQNRNSAKTSILSIFAIDNNSVADANVDTNISGATTIYHQITGSGKDAGSHSHDLRALVRLVRDQS